MNTNKCAEVLNFELCTLKTVAYVAYVDMKVNLKDVSMDVSRDVNNRDTVWGE